MNPKWAEENLQTIRTLMERSALYRRALAPIMLFAGTLGILAAGIGLYFQIVMPRAFATLWFSTAGLVLAGSFLLSRRQALKDHEPFWSPPTSRVAQALLPPLLSGLVVGVILIVVADRDWGINFVMAAVWILFYGCALHSAGSFMTRGIKRLGWIFIIGVIPLLFITLAVNYTVRETASLTMGFFFGGLHLAYGIYLYFTEKKIPNA